MNRVKTVITVALWLAASSFPLIAQNAQQNDAERYRLELAERVRQEMEQKDWETKIFQIKYVDPNELRAVLSMFRSSINYSGGGLRVLSIRAPKEIMPAIEDAIKRLDVPTTRRDAELTVFVVLASDQPDSGGPIPTGLQPVVTQLRTVFSYKSYQLVDTLITRTNGTGSAAMLNGTLALGANSGSYAFTTRSRFENLDGKVPLLRLNDMRFTLQAAGQRDLIISADVDVPQGQQVVVGKATMGDKALILIMTSKFSN